MRIAIVGSRTWPRDKEHIIQQFIGKLPKDTVVISGGADGVDTMAERWAKRNGLETIVIPVTQAEWRQYGRSAGPRRNTKIVAMCDRVVAFWDGRSTGTANTIMQARQAGKQVDIYECG